MSREKHHSKQAGGDLDHAVGAWRSIIRLFAREEGTVVVCGGILLAATSAVADWRASIEETIWCDEIYSLMLVRHSAGEIVRLASFDSHPPGYYLFLKLWMTAGQTLGVDPSIFWVRLPGALAWAGLAWAAWAFGRPVFNSGAGELSGSGLSRTFEISDGALIIDFQITVDEQQETTFVFRHSLDQERYWGGTNPPSSLRVKLEVAAIYRD